MNSVASLGICGGCEQYVEDCECHATERVSMVVPSSRASSTLVSRGNLPKLVCIRLDDDAEEFEDTAVQKLPLDGP